MGLFGPPNVGKMEAKRDVKGLINALGYQKDASVRRVAAAALGKIGDARAVDPLSAALKDNYSNVRHAAADALGRIGDARAVEPLIAALQDSFGVRGAAADALDKIGWRPRQDEIAAAYWAVKEGWDKCIEIGSPAVAPLVAVLKDSPYFVRRAAAQALGRIGDARAVAPLSTALKDGDWEVRAAAVGAMVKIGTPAVAALMVALEDGDCNVRKQAAGALDEMDWRPGKDESGAAYWIAKKKWDKCIEIGAPAVAALSAALQDSDHHVRKVAADGLGRIGDARAVEPLSAALKDSDDSDSNVRRAAVEALEKIGDTRAVEALIAVLKDSHRWVVRPAAAYALGRIGDARAVEPLIAALKDSHSDLRRAAVEALEKIGDARAVEALMAALKDDGELVHEAADAMVKFGTATVEPLMVALKDGDCNVRKQAAYALGRIGDVRAVEPLIAALKDTDRKVRSEAAYVLGKVGDARAVGPLMTALKDSDSHVRWAAAGALGKIGDARVVEPLIAVLKDGDRWVRGEAAEALEKMGWRPGQDESSAAYWVDKRRWDRCIEIGALAVVPLIGALGDGEWSVRQAAADTLVKLYTSNLLDEAYKQLILVQRGRISAGHDDKTEVYSTGQNSDCTLASRHTDSGTGVVFPI